MPTFNVGEKVLCFDGPLLYEGKCLQKQNVDRQTQYYIHYFGWNKRWDEWVEEPRVLKLNNANRKRQKDAVKQYEKQKGLKKIRQPLLQENRGSASNGHILSDSSTSKKRKSEEKSAIKRPVDKTTADLSPSKNKNVTRSTADNKKLKPELEIAGASESTCDSCVSTDISPSEDKNLTHSTADNKKLKPVLEIPGASESTCDSVVSADLSSSEDKNLTHSSTITEPNKAKEELKSENPNSPFSDLPSEQPSTKESMVPESAA